MCVAKRSLLVAKFDSSHEPCRIFADQRHSETNRIRLFNGVDVLLQLQTPASNIFYKALLASDCKIAQWNQIRTIAINGPEKKSFDFAR